MGLARCEQLAVVPDRRADGRHDLADLLTAEPPLAGYRPIARPSGRGDTARLREPANDAATGAKPVRFDVTRVLVRKDGRALEMAARGAHGGWECARLYPRDGTG